MYFLYRTGTNKYLTIHREDLNKFKEISKNFTRKLSNGERVPCENNFRVITDKKEIKQILEDNFSSKNRGSENTTGLPSATLISSALFPIDVEKEFNLLNWHNSIPADEYNMQQITNKLSTDSGEFCHEVLELAFGDKKTRLFDKKNRLEIYIDEICKNGKVNRIIDNFSDRKDYFKNMAMQTLGKFFQTEFCNIDPIFNELFLKTKYIQGCIDMINYKNGHLYISDFKTSKKSCSRAQIPHKGYLRQLYIYSRMLLDNNIISKKEYDNLHFQILFFNWNSHNSAVYEYTKEEIDKCRAYVRFILQWYHKIKGVDVEDVI